MRGSGATVGLVALPIAGLILLILKIFRIKHSYDLMDMAGLVIAWLAGWRRLGRNDSILSRYRAWHLPSVKSALMAETQVTARSPVTTISTARLPHSNRPAARAT